MQIIQILWDRREFFLTCLMEHIRISLTAVVCAGVLGILAGIFISRHRKLAGVVLGVINVIYTIPSISLLGFLIPFTGIGNKTAIIALTVYGLLPIVRNTYTGLTNETVDVWSEIPAGASGDHQWISQYGSDDYCNERYCFFYRCGRTWFGDLQGDYYL